MQQHREAIANTPNDTELPTIRNYFNMELLQYGNATGTKTQIVAFLPAFAV
ncbi:hypothetical protein KIN20_019075 [Parelaphostrongylus tenuis]|uniref:Uncharacterized protein n=1 Tax=Parelaphostrongylus tenuis TaxID=148309 RepID=A0AAD5QUU2_PARTN|nr:hypothetical protein KIN20_019075 [Parelaphostrongylus tenuis]